MTSPNIGPGNIPNVPGAQPTNLLGMGAHAARGEAQWREQIDGAFKSRANGSGIGSWRNQIIGWLTDLFTLTGQHEEEIHDLQDKNQVLEGIIGHGQWYMKSKLDTSGTIRAVFDTQSGPAVGCSNLGGVVTLNSKGLWAVKVRARSDVAIGGAAYLKALLRAVMPNGDILAEAEFIEYPSEFNFGATTRPGTINIWLDPVCPVPGCRIELWIDSGGIARRYKGGPRYNMLQVDKISNELGPGMRLSSPFQSVFGTWTTLGPMEATGGAALTSNRAIVGPGVTSARIDAVVVGSANFDVYIRKRTSAGGVGATIASSNGKSAHQMVWEGSVTPGESIEIMVGGDAQIYASGGATWLTIMNKDQTSGDE